MEYLTHCKAVLLNVGGEAIRSHPKACAVGTIGLVVTSLPITVPATLGAAGFAATGPALGSFAAAWQASIGSVAAGSVFSWLQSAAMGGALAQAISAAPGVGMGIMGSAALSTKWDLVKGPLVKGVAMALR